MSRLSIKCGGLDISISYGHRGPVTRTALVLYLFSLISNHHLKFLRYKFMRHPVISFQETPIASKCFLNTILPRRNCWKHPLRQDWRLSVKIAIHVAVEIRVLSSTEGEVSIDRYRLPRLCGKIFSRWPPPRIGWMRWKWVEVMYEFSPVMSCSQLESRDSVYCQVLGRSGWLIEWTVASP
jgi:hypothetical protein